MEPVLKTPLASVGAIGGAGNEAGGGFRAGLAAYVAVHVLRGQPFAELDLMPEQAIPVAMQLEADESVDDLQVTLVGGTAFIQAKRRLDFRATGDSSMHSVVKQWIALSENRSIDPSRERLVAATATASGPILALRDALRRRRRALAGNPTCTESEALSRLFQMLDGAANVDRIVDSATIWIADLEEVDGLAARLAQALLEPGVVPPGSGLGAWKALREGARDLARKRYGATLEDLSDLLRAVPFSLTLDAEGYASARAEERRATLAAYRRRVMERGETIDLRGLGASLPPLPLAELDAQVEVVEPPADGNEARKHEYQTRNGGLPWALRRRGRSLLLGLPGSGKSVALRKAAAHYAARETWPLPIVVRLDRVARLLEIRGFGEALLEVAFQDEPVSDQAALRDAAIEAMRNGDAALFLDALDETRQLRSRVVAGIQNEMQQIHPAVELLLSTRDVAYADAHTLGLHDLRLVAPEKPQETAQAVLRATADQRHMRPEDAKQWIDDRAAWINDRLRTDRALAETPLMVVLLALLAAEHRAEDLPTTRGAVLKRVVDDVVARWEAGLRLQDRRVKLGSLENGDAVHAAQSAFPIIGDLAFQKIDPRRDQVMNALGKGFRQQFGLSPGLVRSVAEDALALWDEAGVFVVSGSTVRLQARLRLFAELGYAISVCATPSNEQRTWLRQAITHPAQREPLLLTAGLSDVIAEALMQYASDDPSSEPALDLVADAIRQGAVAKADVVARLAISLTESDAASPQDRWSKAKVLIELPVAGKDQERCLQFFASLSNSSCLVARAISVNTWKRNDGNVENDLLAILRMEPTNRRHDSGATERRVLALTTPDADYQRAVLIAVEHLLHPGRDDVAQLIAKRMRSGVSIGVSRRLTHALIEAGFQSIVAEAQREQIQKWREINWTKDIGLDVDSDQADSRLLEIIASLAPPAQLDRIARRRLDSIVSLVWSSGFEQAVAGEAVKGIFKDGERLAITLRAAALLGSLDLSVTSAQAQELLAVFTEEGDAHLGPLFMLIDGARDLQFDAWDRVDDQIELAVSLADAVTSPYSWIGYLALNCLVSIPSPARDFAHDALAERLPTTRRRVQFLVALTMLMLSGDGSSRTLFTEDSRPMVRRAAAHYWREGKPEQQRAVLTKLLKDTDAGVRLDAIESLREIGIAQQVQAELEDALREPQNWQCFWCGVDNEAHSSNCSKCGSSPPDLEREVKAALSSEKVA